MQYQEPKLKHSVHLVLGTHFMLYGYEVKILLKSIISDSNRHLPFLPYKIKSRLRFLLKIKQRNWTIYDFKA